MPNILENTRELPLFTGRFVCLKICLYGISAFMVIGTVSTIS